MSLGSAPVVHDQGLLTCCALHTQFAQSQGTGLL